MSTTAGRRDGESREMLLAGAALFAASMLGIVGFLQLMEGIAAVAKDDIYVTGIAYVYQFDVTTWGWIHIIVGAVAIGSAVGIFMDQGWARVVGIVLAVIGAVVNFAFIPYYPVWSLVVIGMYGLVIWALCAQVGRRA